MGCSKPGTRRKIHMSNKDCVESPRHVTWLVEDARLAFNHPETGELIVLNVCGTGEMDIGHKIHAIYNNSDLNGFSFELTSNGGPIDVNI